jgi:hypothetical protein
MPVKFKSNLILDQLIPDIKKGFARGEAKKVKDSIVKTIQSGESPAKGFGKYEQYNKKYADRYKGGKRLPVNLTRTGKMLRSIKTFVTSKGNITIFFSSPTAKFHDLAGLARVLRKMLPNDGEFIQKIQTRIIQGYNNAIIKAVKKQNR